MTQPPGGVRLRRSSHPAAGQPRLYSHACCGTGGRGSTSCVLPVELIGG